MFRPALVAVILLLTVGVLAALALSSHVGGVMMRNNVVRGKYLTLDFSRPAMRGVPVTVRWMGKEDMANEAVRLVWRSGAGEEIIGAGKLSDQTARVMWPCDSAAHGTLMLTLTGSGQVVGYTETDTLPAGPECAF